MGRSRSGLTRQDRVRDVGVALGDRELVWFGIRGTDAAPFLVIPQFTQSFAITAPLRAAKLTRSETLEELTGRRVDLDAYDIDFDAQPAVDAFRRQLLAAMNRPVAITTYRPSHFLSALTFITSSPTPMRSGELDLGTPMCRYLGLFKDRHVAFEHKPWVETELRPQLTELGIRMLPWRYVAVEHKVVVERLLERGPLILRPNRTSGGAGIWLVRTPDELASRWIEQTESSARVAFNDHFMGVCQYIHPSIPINVGGCVYSSEEVVLHPASLQLIGVDGFTTRRFGYCGNDFAGTATLELALVGKLDIATRRIGRWLGSQGYRGAFGADYLAADDDLYFAEVNARMQGSTALSASLASMTGHVDICLDHVSAFLGLPPTEPLTLSDWLAELPPAAHLIRHNLADEPARVDGSSEFILRMPPGVRPMLIPDDEIAVEPGAVLCRYEFDRQITTTGFELFEEVRRGFEPDNSSSPRVGASTEHCA